MTCRYAPVGLCELLPTRRSRAAATVCGSSVSGRELVHGRPVRGDAKYAADRDERRVTHPAGALGAPDRRRVHAHDPREHPPAETAPLAGPPQPLAETPAERIHAVELGKLPVVILDNPLCRMPLAPQPLDLGAHGLLKARPVGVLRHERATSPRRGPASCRPSRSAMTHDCPEPMLARSRANAASLQRPDITVAAPHDR